MIRSMTGFGEAELDTRLGRLRAEVRTVNHRYFSLNIRLGRRLERFEPQIRDWIRGLLPRGHVNFSLRLQSGDGEEGAALRLDEVKARQYLRLLRSLKDRLDVPGDVDLALLARFGDLFVAEDDGAAELPDADELRTVTEAAARNAIVMREDEGRRLGDDLEQRLQAVERAMSAIEQLAPARLVTERDRMRRVVNELLGGSVLIDEDRIAREIALLAERWDISEELVRLRSHIELFRASLADPEPTPVGKRLSFLTQEMNRETNTIGSKANDAALEHQVIAIKDEIERLREQVENIE